MIQNATDQVTARRPGDQPLGGAAHGVASAVRPSEQRRQVEAGFGGAAGGGRPARQGSGRRGAGGSGEIDARRDAESQLAAAKAKKEHDQVLFDYAKITAPFTGVVTQRYANLGTLMQAGTVPARQAMPLVRLSEDDLFRLVIPVPESYVHYIHVGDPVNVLVPSLNRTFPGKSGRFSVDVKEDTRTMHTEVDVPNPQRMPDAGAVRGSDPHAGAQGQRSGCAAAGGEPGRRPEPRSTWSIPRGNKIEDRKVKLGLQTAQRCGESLGAERRRRGGCQRPKRAEAG